MIQVTQSGILGQQVFCKQTPRRVVRHHDRQGIDLWVVSAEPEYTGLDEWWQCQSVVEIVVQNIHQAQCGTSSPKELTSIKEFPGEPYRALKPIPVKIHLLDETTFEASFEEGNIRWSDDSESEVIEGLRVEILNAFEDFEAHESILGPEPKRQLSVLRSYVQKL